MNPLNDDELNSLLRQAKDNPPKPGPQLAARALRAYRRSVAPSAAWRCPITIPWPLGALAALLLVVLGAVGSRVLRPPSVIVQTRTVEIPAASERVVYRDCPAQQTEPGAGIASLTFKELPPVRQIKARVVRSIRYDQ